jgi:hypothetical protein
MNELQFHISTAHLMLQMEWITEETFDAILEKLISNKHNFDNYEIRN